MRELATVTKMPIKDKERTFVCAGVTYKLSSTICPEGGVHLCYTKSVPASSVVPAAMHSFIVPEQVVDVPVIRSSVHLKRYGVTIPFMLSRVRLDIKKMQKGIARDELLQTKMNSMLERL